METQYWLAELDDYGNPTLVDGAHSEREGAEKAMTLMNSLTCISMDDRKFAIAEVILTKPTGEHGPLNQDAIDTLNTN